MHYVTIEQEKWLIAHGMKPSCPDKGIPLTEAAQWFWDRYNLDCAYNIQNKHVWGTCNVYDKTDGWEVIKVGNSPTVPEALSWAIDQAINHVNQQSNGTD